MVLIKSISGIRGTLENIPGKSLSDIDIVQFSLAYVQEVILKSQTKNVVMGRDARKSGKRIAKLVSKTLLNEGVDVVDLGLVTTPTLGISVKNLQVAGGIMVSASHNDEKWNALKLLSDQGEFLSPKIIKKIIYAFKISSLPGTDGDHARIYTFPNEWAIRFHGPFKDYIDYPLISICTGIDIDFTGGQSFQAMIDGAPTAVTLKVSFTETTTLNRKKYAEGASAFIN